MIEKEYKEDYRVGTITAVLIIIAFAVLILLELEYDIIPLMSLVDTTGEIEKILLAIITIAITWLVLHHFGRFFERITTSKIGSHAQARSMWKLISYAIWIFVFIVILLSLIGEVSSLILYIGLIGAALTFALQKPILDVSGWALITYRRLFRIGDRISLGGAKGYVLDITPMYTELREFGEWMRGDTFTGRIITVPNSVIFDQPTYNYTRDFPFVWDEVTNLVTYESDIDAAKRYMLESAKEVVGELMAENYEKYRRKLEIRDLEQLLLKEPELRMELSDSGVNIYVLYFCPVELRRKLKGEMTERIWRRFMADPNVGIAYPHMHLVGRLNQ